MSLRSIFELPPLKTKFLGEAMPRACRGVGGGRMRQARCVLYINGECLTRNAERARTPSRFARSQSALPAGHPVGVGGDAQTASRATTAAARFSFPQAQTPAEDWLTMPESPPSRASLGLAPG